MDSNVIGIYNLRVGATNDYVRLTVNEQKQPTLIVVLGLREET